MVRLFLLPHKVSDALNEKMKYMLNFILFIMDTKNQFEHAKEVKFTLGISLIQSLSCLIVSSHTIATHSLKFLKCENCQTLMTHFSKAMENMKKPSKPMARFFLPLSKNLSQI